MTRAILAMLFLAGCTQTATDTSCTAFQPITFSAKQDSQETIRQVRGHNAAWDKICGGK